MTPCLRVALPLEITLYTRHIVPGHITSPFEPVSRLEGAFVAFAANSGRVQYTA